MTPDDGMAQLHRLGWLGVLDGTRPSRPLDWVSPVTPVVTQAVTGAGHWAAGRRRRAVAAWTCAAGFGLVAWGLAAEAPTAAEAAQNLERQKDSLRELGLQVPATAGRAPGAEHWSQRGLEVVVPAVNVVVGLWWGLRRPRRRLTPLAITDEAMVVALYGARAARAGQRRRPRMAVGSALIAAGALARLRALAAEPIS